MVICNDCKGKKVVTCPECGGTGNRYYVAVLDIWESDCSACFGSGSVTCPACELLPLAPPHPIHPSPWPPTAWVP